MKNNTPRKYYITNFSKDTIVLLLPNYGVSPWGHSLTLTTPRLLRLRRRMYPRWRLETNGGGADRQQQCAWRPVVASTWLGGGGAAWPEKREREWSRRRGGWERGGKNVILPHQCYFPNFACSRYYETVNYECDIISLNPDDWDVNNLFFP